MGKKILQTNKKLDPQVQAWGCYFRSLQGIAEDSLGFHLSPKEINSLYEKGQRDADTWAGFVKPMKANCWVSYPDAIVKQAFELMGTTHSAVQIGANKGGGPGSPMTFWDWVYDTGNFSYHYQVRWYQIAGKNWRHAILCDETGRTLFNPDPSLPLVGEPTIELWRVK